MYLPDARTARLEAVRSARDIMAEDVRRGVLGFFTHPELSKASETRTSGNYALLDLIAALEGAGFVSGDSQEAAKAAVLSDVEPGTTVAGIPAVPLHQWRRQVVRLSRLDELQRRVKALERRLAGRPTEQGPEDEPEHESGKRGGES